MNSSLSPAWFAGWKCLCLLLGALCPWRAPMSVPPPTTLDGVLSMLVFGWGGVALLLLGCGLALRRTGGRSLGAGLGLAAVLTGVTLGSVLPRGQWPLGAGAIPVGVLLWSAIAAGLAARLRGRSRGVALSLVVVAIVLGAARAAPRFRSRAAMWAAAVAAHPGDEGVYRGMLSLPEHRGAAERARVLERCLATSPDAPWCLQQRIAQAAADGQHARVLALAPRRMRAAPQDGSTAVALAIAFSRLRPADDDALSAARDAVGLLPEDGRAQLALAIVADARRDPTTALRALDAAIAQGADGLEARVLQSSLALRRNDLPAARAAVERALREAPDDPRARYNLGLVAQRQGRLNESREAYLRALRGDPSAYAPRFNLVLLTRDVGALSEARHHAEALVRAHPGDAAAQALLRSLGEAGAS